MKKFKRHSFLEQLDNTKGVSLVTVLLFVAVISGLSVMVMKSNRLRTQQSVKMHADKEVDLAMAKLTSFFSSPVHCNANLRGRNFAAKTYVAGDDGYSLGTHLRTCASSSCTYATGTNTFRTDFTAGNSGVWSADVTGFPMAITTAPASTMSSRVRIVRAFLSIDTSFPVPAAPPSGDIKPWTARLAIRFEKNLGPKPGTSTLLTSFVDRVIHFPVALSSKTLAINSTTITGCPRASNTTMLP